MNVGITCYPTYGGSGIVATELGMELAARGHEVHFITYANPIRLDPDTPRIHYHEVEVSNYPLFQYPPYCLALAGADGGSGRELRPGSAARALRDSAFDRGHAGAADAGAGMRRLPFITTLHGTDITLVGADPSYFGITKFSIEKSDGITSISDNLREQTVEIFGVPNEIRVIKNFVNCDLYRPDNEKKGAAAYAPDGEKLLIHLSNFRPGEARAGLHPHSGGGAQERAGATADGGRRSGARSGGAPGAQLEGGPARDRFWASRITWSG